MGKSKKASGGGKMRKSTFKRRKSTFKRKHPIKIDKSLDSLKKKRSTKLDKKYSKHKLMTIDTMGISGSSFTKTKNNGLKLAKEKGMKYLMCMDWSEGDRLYDVNTKKTISRSSPEFKKLYKIVYKK